MKRNANSLVQNLNLGCWFYFPQKVDYSRDLGEGKVKQEMRLEPCLTMVVIDPLSAMWALWAKLDIHLNLGPGMYALL